MGSQQQTGLSGEHPGCHEDQPKTPTNPVPQKGTETRQKISTVN